MLGLKELLVKEVSKVAVFEEAAVEDTEKVADVELPVGEEVVLCGIGLRLEESADDVRELVLTLSAVELRMEDSPDVAGMVPVLCGAEIEVEEPPEGVRLEDTREDIRVEVSDRGTVLVVCGIGPRLEEATDEVEIGPVVNGVLVDRVDMVDVAPFVEVAALEKDEGVPVQCFEVD